MVLKKGYSSPKEMQMHGQVYDFLVQISSLEAWFKSPIPASEHGNIGSNANIKGFAFEYMTNGRGLVLGDPGPWICAGMTGGAIYIRHQPEMGLTKGHY